MGQQQIRPRRNAGANHKERRRGDVRRNIHRAGAQAPPAAQRNRAVFLHDPVTESAQHALGVIARGRSFGHGGLALGEQPRQQHAGLDLRAGHRQCVVNGAQRRAPGDAQRRAAPRRGLQHGAHSRQGRDHPLHGPAHQRGVAAQFAGEVLPGQDARQQAHTGAGIAHIQRRLRRLQPP